MKWQTLAPELIYEVLNECRGSKTLIVTKLRVPSFPWHLGHICRAWREVFVSSSQFWNTLDINLDFSWFQLNEEMHERSRERALDLVRISMVRSRDSPISFKLSITGYSEVSPAETAMCRQMIEILVANSARWHNAYIDLPADEMSTIYAAKSRMPLLRSIKLGLQTHVGDDNAIVQSHDAAKLYSDFLMDATQLTRISFNANSPFLKINWSLITVIHFHTPLPLSQLLAYLSQMSCLMELAFFDGYMRDIISDDEIVPITLPHLKSLYSLRKALLPIIETPALQELHILDDISTVENESVQRAIFCRYFRSIRHLSKLEIFACNSKDTALIMEHMPRVDHLILYSKTPVGLLQIVKDYPQIGFLKTVTFMLHTNDAERNHLLEIITSWKRKTEENRGIGPFRNLTKMSFKLLDSHRQRTKRFVDGLKLHLEEQGMHYSIRRQIHLGLPFPRFDVL